ncbi:glycogen debranching N-terminal domain-containing protein [Kibdelosporangium aridum]|uniref:amylo-alpha-1,6-glucosidase n=1 Tax=Kibdelosporangium aridum TaxID=2030 RepID=UPI0006906691|nr:glycogen debranching N-terminal domain-containing protein [Kibdelosporangium aridum]
MTGPSTSLHSLVTVLKAPSLVLSDQDGQLPGTGSTGWFIRDKRALARVQLTIADAEVVTVGRDQRDPWTASFHAVAKASGARWRDSTLHVRRERELDASSLVERFEVTNFDDVDRTLTVVVHVATDFAGVDAVKAGRAASLITPSVTGEALSWQDSVTLRAEPAAAVTIRDSVAELTWHVTVAAGEAWRLSLHADATVEPADFAQVSPVSYPQWTPLPNPVAERNLADLRALLLADEGDIYAAAGSPWYLTLFGRDSIWAARLSLPLGTDLAAGTLRALARRQGNRHDPAAEQQPGKIPHELRPGAIDTGQVRLSSRYYGTIDATPLWICLLHEASRAGMPVDPLLPNLVAAMNWLTGPDADPDGDGLIEYQPAASGGLTHHGWKDSHDAFLHQDGRHPKAPIALCEVQGYAYAAAVAAAALDPANGPQWMDWAARLRERFRSTFWIEDASGRYPAIALDADKNPVVGATSNMGHLLGTGLLDAEEVELVAARLGRSDMLTPFGLRTSTADSAMFNPFSYHRGSVWPHDTAIVMVGLAAEGKHELAGLMAESILRASEHFGGHTPELYAVLDGQPLAYPNACVPQAWSAAGVVRAALYLATAP